MITPDAKDWTWVVERPCPECGYDAAAVTDLPGDLRRACTGWGAKAQDRDRPNDATWSPYEYTCHIRDVVVLYHQRLQLMLTEDDPLYPNWDQDAAAEHYGDEEPAQVVAQLEAASARLADAFAALTPDQWQRPGRRSDGATFTVDTFARYLLHDLLHHRKDVGVEADA